VNTFLFSSASEGDSGIGTWVLPDDTISIPLSIGYHTIIVKSSDPYGNQNQFEAKDILLIHAFIDLKIEKQLQNSGIIKAGDKVIYRITVTNTDPVNTFLFSSASEGDSGIYDIMPDILTLPIGMFSTSNPNISCQNGGPAANYGDALLQYANKNLIICSILNDLPANSSIYFDIETTASIDLPDGTTNSVLIYDSARSDHDSDLISNAANANEDIFSLNINSVAKSVYNIPTNTSSEARADSTSAKQKDGLANTGSNLLVSSINSTLIVISSWMLFRLAKKIGLISHK
jgi:hypothetical protein